MEDGPRLAPETARRLACDASLVAIVDDADGNAVAASPQTRTIPAALRPAVHARDQRCVFPGCDRPIAQIHHIEYRSRGGPTVLPNLAGVCWFHHRLVHEGGSTIELGEDGRPRFFRPDGKLIDPAPAIEIDPDDGGIERRNDEHGIEIAADAVTTEWWGDTLDPRLATDNLMWDRRRGQRDVA